MLWQLQRREEEQAAAATAAQQVEEDLPDMELETCAIMAVWGPGRQEPPAAGADNGSMGVVKAHPAGHGCSSTPAAANGAEDGHALAQPAVACAASGSPVLGPDLGPSQSGGAVDGAQLLAQPLASTASQPAKQAADTTAQVVTVQASLPAAAKQLDAHPAPFDQPAVVETLPAAGQDPPTELDAALSSAFGQAGQQGAGLEPTMTISTRNAFAAINQMFGVRLGLGGEGTKDRTNVRSWAEHVKLRSLPLPPCSPCGAARTWKARHDAPAVLPACPPSRRPPSLPTLPSSSLPAARLGGLLLEAAAAVRTNPP